MTDSGTTHAWWDVFEEQAGKNGAHLTDDSSIASCSGSSGSGGSVGEMGELPECKPGP